MAEEVLIVASKVRQYLKAKGVKMSGELINALNKRVVVLLDDAASRTRGNKRSTVKPQDV